MWRTFGLALILIVLEAGEAAPASLDMAAVN
jgi:hypothetical protein